MAAYAALLSLAQTTNPNTTQHESLFSSDAAEKVGSIHNYVISLLWFFQEFPEKVNRWEGRINDLSYEIDTIIESFLWQRIQSGHGLKLKLEDQLENVMERLGQIAGEVTEERPAYVPASSSSSTLPTVGNDAVIGLHEDVIMAIKGQLCGDSRKLQVIPITGMGGIGKTTLARTLYNDKLIIGHFDVRAWAVASQDYSPLMFKKNLFDSMIVPGKQMLRDEIDESEILLKMYQTLKGRRYIVVLDDVWERIVWDDVMSMFPDDNNGSRIMLTTRQWDVAIYPGSAAPVHEMECMDESQSWDLLRQKVFTNGYCPPELEEVGKEIARRCGGLPLAVVLIAGVLSATNEINLASWEEIAKNVSSIVGRELEAILSLSYTNLPHHLRSCFLFIGGFQKGVYIRNSRLIRLWAAEGFQRMEERCQKSFEEKADEYLEDLVKRNLVIVTNRKIDGKIKSCRLHDMVRDMCIKKAHEEKFLHAIEKFNLPQGLADARRISISRSNVGTIWAPSLRTILSFQIQNVPNWLASLENYNLLRELDALGVDLKELPSQLFELYHLRYLALKGSFSIPSVVSNLVHLETLIIHLPFGKVRGRYSDVVTHSLPLEIWSLPQLRHLFFHAPYVLPHPPRGLTYLPLKYLQTLLLVANLVWNDEIIQLIPNVKRLGLTYTSNKEHHLHLLDHLDQLEKLEVIGYPGFSLRAENPNFPSKLKKLSLVGGGFPWSDMDIVGSLPNLQVLKLLDNACDGETWETADESFPSLIYLLIDGSNLLEWTTESGSFPKLKRLVLRSCMFLKKIPEDIGDIPTLELIEVDYCTESLVESAKEIKQVQEDYGNYALQVRFGHKAKLRMPQLGVDEDEDEDEGGKYVNPQSICYSRTGGEIADAAIGFLQNTLEDLLKYRTHLIKDARGDIKNLERDLHVFKAFLRDTVNIRKTNEMTEEIVKEIHDVVYEVEDIIEVFVTKSIERRNKSVFARFWSTLASDFHSIVNKVEAIKGRVERCRQEMGIDSLDEDQCEKPEPPPTRKKHVVGFEDVTEHLIDRLLTETDYFDVISIIGMLGLGKTTVAWKIFNDRRIVYKFPIRIWLPISQQFTYKEIILRILKEFVIIDENMRARTENDLTYKVDDLLKEKRFLIILDDVWSTSHWDRLRAALPHDNKKGKVLITSRFEEVGIHASYPRHLYGLRFLTFEESWKLFWLEALRGLDCPPELANVGHQIAGYCKGLPLAIIVIGGILATKFSPTDVTATKRDWVEVSARVRSYLTENDLEHGMQKLISLSYDNLPSHLCLCFLYLGMFPEDYEIPVSKLICMWIGEGFIQQDDDYTLEETAEKYLENLVNRNLVRSDKLKGDGKVKTCRVHDSIRDFCHSEAANANFLQEIKYNNDGQSVPSISDIGTCRRLSVNSNCSNFILLESVGPRVRSFVCFPKDKYDLSLEDSANIIRAFQLLRVLDVSAFKFTRIDSDLYKLVHTRYIAFSSKLSVLSSEFNKLWNIQTIIVETTSRTLQVRADIWKMKRLRHFKTNASATLPEPTENDNHNAELQTLGSISVESCTEELTRRACNLKKLSIRGKLVSLFDKRNVSLDSLGKMKKLGKLKLINDVYPKPLSTWRLGCLPEPHRFPSELTSLTISATFLGWEHMSTLGLLKKLEVLKLKNGAFVGSIWESVDGGFQCLEILHIEDTDLVVWNASSHHYPKLRGLVLKKCKKLLGIPIELAGIPSLQMLELYYTCISAAESARQISVAKTRVRGSEFQLSVYPPNE